MTLDLALGDLGRTASELTDLARRYYKVLTEEWELSLMLQTPGVSGLLGNEVLAQSFQAIEFLAHRAEELYEAAGRPNLVERERYFKVVRCEDVREH